MASSPILKCRVGVMYEARDGKFIGRSERIEPIERIERDNAAIVNDIKRLIDHVIQKDNLAQLCAPRPVPIGNFELCAYVPCPNPELSGSYVKMGESKNVIGAFGHAFNLNQSREGSTVTLFVKLKLPITQCLENLKFKSEPKEEPSES